MLLGLRDGLRSGDLFVPARAVTPDPAAYLLTTGQWEPQRVEFCGPFRAIRRPGVALATVVAELHDAL
ncbi:hypothetical protein GS903_25180, partial [Rhodococcus hoagii]|nr:hypothetical protein [Prescottella equi]